MAWELLCLMAFAPQPLAGSYLVWLKFFVFQQQEIVDERMHCKERLHSFSCKLWKVAAPWSLNFSTASYTVFYSSVKINGGSGRCCSRQPPNDSQETHALPSRSLLSKHLSNLPSTLLQCPSHEKEGYEGDFTSKPSFLCQRVSSVQRCPETLLAAITDSVQGPWEEKLRFLPVHYSLGTPTGSSYTRVVWSTAREQILAPKLSGICKLPPRTLTPLWFPQCAHW